MTYREAQLLADIGMLFVVDAVGSVLALDTADGRELRCFATGIADTKLISVDASTLFVIAETAYRPRSVERIFALSATTGGLQWQTGNLATPTGLRGQRESR